MITFHGQSPVLALLRGLERCRLYENNGILWSWLAENHVWKMTARQKNINEGNSNLYPVSWEMSKGWGESWCAVRLLKNPFKIFLSLTVFLIPDGGSWKASLSFLFLCPQTFPGSQVQCTASLIPVFPTTALLSISSLPSVFRPSCSLPLLPGPSYRCWSPNMIPRDHASGIVPGVGSSS